MGALADSTSHMDSTTAWGIAVLMLLPAGLFIVIGFRQRSRSLPPNNLAGYRTRTIMTNDATWYAAHSASASYTIAAGIVLLIAGVVVLFNPVLRVANASIAIGMLASFGLIIVGAIIGQRAAKHVLQHETEARGADDGTTED